MERWKSISDFPDYDVSDQGRVRSKKYGKKRILKNRKTSGGHVSVQLFNDGVSETHRVHRLVAEEFIPNPNNYPVVRHLNGIPDDNRVENLSWGTQKDNVHDSIIAGTHKFNRRPMDRHVLECYLEKHRTPIKATNVETGAVRIYPSQLDASNDLGVDRSSMNRTLKRGYGQNKNWTFSYIEEIE